MARNRKKSAPAEEHNAEAEEVRQEARDNQSNVVDMLTPAERWKKRQALILGLAERLDATHHEAERVRDDIKSIRLDAKTENVDWKALTQMVSLRRKAEKKRLASERSRREVARAFGWDDGQQIDFIDDDSPPEGLIPGQQREFLGPTEPEVTPDMQAALDSGFFTREELGLGASETDVPEGDEEPEPENEDEFASLMERAGVASVREEN